MEVVVRLGLQHHLSLLHLGWWPSPALVCTKRGVDGQMETINEQLFTWAVALVVI
jgi:hypothetical protein